MNVSVREKQKEPAHECLPRFGRVTSRPLVGEAATDDVTDLSEASGPIEQGIKRNDDWSLDDHRAYENAKPRLRESWRNTEYMGPFGNPPREGGRCVEAAPA